MFWESSLSSTWSIRLVMASAVSRAKSLLFRDEVVFTSRSCYARTKKAQIGVMMERATRELICETWMTSLSSLLYSCCMILIKRQQKSPTCHQKSIERRADNWWHTNVVSRISANSSHFSEPLDRLIASAKDRLFLSIEFPFESFSFDLCRYCLLWRDERCWLLVVLPPSTPV